MSVLGAWAEVPIGRTPRKKKSHSVFLFLHTRWCEQVLMILWVHRMADQIGQHLKLRLSREHFLFQIHMGTQSKFFHPLSLSFSVFLSDHSKRETMWLLQQNAKSWCSKLEQCLVLLFFLPLYLVFWFISNLTLPKGFSISWVFSLWTISTCLFHLCLNHLNLVQWAALKMLLWQSSLFSCPFSLRKR